MNEPAAVFVDKHNNLYIADYRNGAIRKVDGTTGIITTVAGGVAGYGGDNGPATNAKLKCTDVWVDDGGAIYIADYVNERVRRVNNALKATSFTDLTTARLYPNPTKGWFEVELTAGAGIVRVCNTAGSVVYESATFTTKTEVDLSVQPEGMYLVYVQCGEDRYVSKVVLSR
jgi:sugar lactone lactonase YvrE